MDTNRIQETMDELAIRKINARYFYAVDSGNEEDYLKVWTSEGVSMGDNGSANGHQELRQSFRRMQQNLSRNKRHFVGNLIIDIDGDSATQHCYLVVLERKEAAKVVATAAYEDELVRTSDGWKFSKRKISVDPSFSYSPTPKSTSD